MRLRKGSTTRKQSAFANAYAATGDAFKSAALAGYRDPHKSAHEVMANPTVLAEVRSQQLARLTNEALPLAMNHIVKTLADDKAPIRDKTMVAKLVLDKVTGENVSSDKELHELTGDELASTIARLHQEIARKTATTIEVQPAESGPGLFD